jgi:hypothetical protein
MLASALAAIRQAPIKTTITNTHASAISEMASVAGSGNAETTLFATHGKHDLRGRVG